MDGHGRQQKVRAHLQQQLSCVIGSFVRASSSCARTLHSCKRSCAGAVCMYEVQRSCLSCSPCDACATGPSIYSTFLCRLVRSRDFLILIDKLSTLPRGLQPLRCPCLGLAYHAGRPGTRTRQAKLSYNIVSYPLHCAARISRLPYTFL